MAKKLSLRAAAAALKISRDKLKALAAAGCAAIVIDGRASYVTDIEAVRSFMAAQNSLVRFAPTLAKDDPRFRERQAMLRLAELKNAQARGELVSVDAALSRFREECAAVRSALDAMPRQVDATTLDQIEAQLRTLADEAINELTIWNPATWPEPQPVSTGPVEEVPQGAQVTLPRLAPGDPRAQIVLANAQRREHEANTLAADLIPLAAVLKTGEENRAEFAAVIGAIPGRVRASLADLELSPANVAAAIRAELDQVLSELSGVEPEAEAA